MLAHTQIVLVLCLTTLDEGTLPLSGQEASGVRERRRAQMEFVRTQSAQIGGQDSVSDEDWSVANVWLQEHIPHGYVPQSRATFAALMSPLPRAVLRKALEVVSAVVQWDGVTTESELALLHDLAHAGKMGDSAALDDLRRIGRKLARG